jgi:hypothetical protein
MLEPIVVTLLLLFAGSIALVVLRLSRGRARTGRVGAFVAGAWGVVCVALVGAAIANRTPEAPLPAADLPLEVTDDDYRSSSACQSCHPYQYATWHRSYHRSMTQRVSKDSVIGDFDDVRISFGDQRFELFRRDGEFVGQVDSPNPQDPKGPVRRHRMELKQTTGSHHMQIYWYPTGNGRSLAAFPLIYLRDQARWIPRQAAFIAPPDLVMDDFGNWNGVCIECHTTRARPRIRDSRRRRSDSHVAELGIACESCHGPGGTHIDANGSPVRRYRQYFSGESDPTIVNPAELPHVRSAQVCGQCHSVKTVFSSEHFEDWKQNGSSFRPGEDLDDSVSIVSNANRDEPSVRNLEEQNPDFLRSMFWGGGIVRVSGREYNGLIESPCFQRGEMSCVSCHSLHKARDDTRSLDEWADDQLGPRMDTNEACLQCHPDFSDTEALARHTHHPLESGGSECQNCHMPHTTYGLLKAIRSHQVDSPSVGTDIDHGRPNACNLCHLDRPLVWTAQHLEQWYDMAVPEIPADDQRIAAGVRWALEGDAGVRALVAWSMGWRDAQEAAGTSWLVPYLAELMDDPYDAVRIIAYRSIKTIPGFEETAFDEFQAPEQRADVTRAVRKRWEGLPAPATGRGPATLFDEYGRVQQSQVDQLLERRDNRPVTLAE